MELFLCINVYLRYYVHYLESKERKKMKKKKVLFIMESLRIGGAEKSLLTILSMLDYEKYDVDLFLFEPEGDFIEFLPREVNLLKSSENYKIFSQNRKFAPLKFLLKLDFKRFYHSFMYLVKCLYGKLMGKFYIGWEHVQYMFDNFREEYDTSIGFLERKTIYFNVDKVKAKNKIGFIHTDYSKYPYDYKSDKKYFAKYNKIATVSEHAKNSLISIFPEYEEKFLVIKNMVSKKIIEQMAEEKLDIEKNEKVMLVTVGRLVPEKGLENAITVCNMLIEHNYDVKWYIIGDGVEKENLKKKIIEYDLQDKFILLGAQKNPYKWMKNCDIYVQTSKIEGFGITVYEAKMLAKPIVVSEIPAFQEQILNGVNGYLAKNNEIMYNKIVEIIENKDGIAEQFVENLKEENNRENKEELEKLYEVMDG